MAIVLTNTRLFIAGADLTGASNKVEIKAQHEVKPATTFGSEGWTEVLAGLGSADFDVEGYFDAGDPSNPDDTAWASLGAVAAWTVCPVNGAANAVAFFTRALESGYDPIKGDVGEIAGFTASGKSAWPVVRGRVAQAPGSPISATGNGSALNLGAVSTGQSLYAAVHVLSASGTTPSLTVSIESDDAETFLDPVERIAFDAATAVGGQIKRAAGPLTDTFYRASFDVSGTDPSFLAVVVIGVA